MVFYLWRHTCILAIAHFMFTFVEFSEKIISPFIALS